jgi:hypothetical protein
MLQIVVETNELVSFSANSVQSSSQRCVVVTYHHKPNFFRVVQLPQTIIRSKHKTKKTTKPRVVDVEAFQNKFATS